MKISNVIKLAVAAVVVCGLNTFAAETQSSSSSPWYLHGDVGVSIMNDLKPKGGGGSASFNTGARADVGLGYNINECFAVELETGVLWNEPKGGGGDLYQIPLLVNGIWNIQTHSAFTPYLGGGVGGAALKLDITDFGSDTAFTFAYQAIAGVKYALSEKLQLDLAYRFFGTLEPEWTINSTTQKFDPLFNHSVVASVTFKF